MSEIPAQRMSHYGSFDDRAAIADGLISALEGSNKWESKPPKVKQALREICGKMSRILNGDHNKKDSWDDICGYAHMATPTQTDNELQSE